METRHSRIGASLCMFLLLGCNQAKVATVPSESEGQPSESSTAAFDAMAGRPFVAQANEGIFIRLGESSSLPGVPRLVRADSWDARVSEFAPGDRAYLEGVGDRYFGSLVFHSPEEQADLVSKGFPMPEEWIAARSVPESELRRLAELGNSKAQIFYIDSVVTRLGPRLRAGGFDSNSPTDIADMLKLLDARTMALRRVASTGSPFAAYQAARVLQHSTQGHDPSVAAGGFQLAHDRGDDRAPALAQQYAAQHADIDWLVAMASYSLLKVGPR